MKLVKETKSICPECLEEYLEKGERPLETLPAILFEEGGAIFIDRKCDKHPDLDLKEIVWSDAEIFYRMNRLAEKYQPKDAKMTNPRTGTTEAGCPNDCGICPEHQSATVLAVIDVTNRCNMHCPICFANAGTAGYLYELPKEQVFSMIDNLRSNSPYPPPALQFSGGEPTLYEDLPEVVRYAKERGFKHIEVNTNGLRIAGPNGDEYWGDLIEAGVSTPYLQFDGVDNEVYKISRGRDDMFDIKLRAMNNMRKAGEDNIVLTVTLVNGVNDHQVGDIINFAIKNKDLVKGVNFQPVSCTGRVDYSKRKEMRITVSDVIKRSEEQTNGLLVADDWYPINIINPVIRVARDLTHHRPPDFSPSVFCGALTMLVEDENEKVTQLPRLMNVEKFMDNLVKVDEYLQRGGRLSKAAAYAKLLWTAYRYVDRTPRSYLFDLLRQQRKGKKEESYPILSEFMKKGVGGGGIFVGCMHFMDSYNYDVERVGSCVVHYATPDEKRQIVPFCTLNNLHRQGIEKKYSVPIEKL